MFHKICEFGARKCVERFCVRNVAFSVASAHKMSSKICIEATNNVTASPKWVMTLLHKTLHLRQ